MSEHKRSLTYVIEEVSEIASAIVVAITLPFIIHYWFVLNSGEAKWMDPELHRDYVFSLYLLLGLCLYCAIYAEGVAILRKEEQEKKGEEKTED